MTWGPSYGHSGKKVTKLVRELGGLAGLASSHGDQKGLRRVRGKCANLQIVTKLSTRPARGPIPARLDLSRATLANLLKYR